jgi:hypothetical protein
MNYLMTIYLVVNFLFLACGGLIVGFSFIGREQQRSTITIPNVAYTLLIGACPLTGEILLYDSLTQAKYAQAGLVNAILVFATFVVSLPALALPTNRKWLTIQGWMVVACSFFTLILGLFVWFDTLQTRKNLSLIWSEQPTAVQSLLQQRVSNSPDF